MFAQIAHFGIHGLRLVIRLGSAVAALAPKRHSPAVLVASGLIGSGVAVCGLAGSAEAGLFPAVPGTGVSTTTVEGITTDNNWRLVAMPQYVCTGDTPTVCNSAPVLAPSPSTPAPVYIPSTVPNSWATDVEGSNGTAIDGTTYQWITYVNYPNLFGATGTVNSQSFFNRVGSQLTIPTVVVDTPFSGNHTYIMATEFEAIAGTYNLAFDASADNRFQLYLLQGALSSAVINYANPQRPTIDGATLLAENAANTPGQFKTIWNETNSSDVKSQLTFDAGTYTLFLAATDDWAASKTFGSTGAFMGATLFTEVPGPLPILGLGAALATSRKLKRRIRNAQSTEAKSSR